MAESLAEFFLEHFRAHKWECAYRQRRGYRTEAFSYGEIVEMAYGFSGELQSRGLAKGDRVMLWGENSAEWVAVFFGCVLSGIAIVPMDDSASADFAMRVSKQVGAKMLVVSRQHEQSSATSLIPNLVLEDVSRASKPGATPLPRISLGRSDTLQIVFTSGTTADPKGVVITHGNVLSNIAPLEREMKKYLKYERFVHPIRFLNLLPLSHVFGQFLAMFLPPLLGGTVIFRGN